MVLNLAADLIKSFEGFMPISKWDYKQFSWGYGTKAPADKLPITKAQASAELAKRIKLDTNKIYADLKKPISDNALAALLSFTYNLGYGHTRTLVDKINAGVPLPTVAETLRKYHYAGGKSLPSLVTRRNKEAQLLLS